MYKLEASFKSKQALSKVMISEGIENVKNNNTDPRKTK